LNFINKLVEDTENNVKLFSIEKHNDVISEVHSQFHKYNCTEWDDACYDVEDQYKRLSKAVNDKFIIKSIDCFSMSAEIQGSDIYICSLYKCSCSDFSLRKLPCKHIYRLLIELDNANTTVNKTVNIPCNNPITFVVAGTFIRSREDIENAISRIGGRLSSSVSKKTDYLVAGNNAGLKEKKAIDLDIKIISEDEFFEMFSKSLD